MCNNLDNIMKIYKPKILNNGVICGYVKNKNGKLVWRILANPIIKGGKYTYNNINKSLASNISFLNLKHLIKFVKEEINEYINNSYTYYNNSSDNAPEPLPKPASLPEPESKPLSKEEKEKKEKNNINTSQFVYGEFLNMFTKTYKQLNRLLNILLNSERLFIKKAQNKYREMYAYIFKILKTGTIDGINIFKNIYDILQHNGILEYDDFKEVSFSNKTYSDIVKILYKPIYDDFKKVSFSDKTFNNANNIKNIKFDDNLYNCITDILTNKIEVFMQFQEYDIILATFKKYLIKNITPEYALILDDIINKCNSIRNFPVRINLVINEIMKTISFEEESIINKFTNISNMIKNIIYLQDNKCVTCGFNNIISFREMCKTKKIIKKTHENFKSCRQITKDDLKIFCKFLPPPPETFNNLNNNNFKKNNKKKIILNIKNSNKSNKYNKVITYINTIANNNEAPPHLP